MGASAEFITGTVFASVMVMIGLGAIWIVRWQTFFLLRNQNHDLERGPVLAEAHTCDAESVEFDSLPRPSTNCSNSNNNACHDFDDSGTTTADSRSTLGTPSTKPANIGHTLGASILENHPATQNGFPVLQSSTSSFISAHDQNSGIDSTNDKQIRTTDGSMLSGTTLLEEAEKVDQGNEE